MLSLFKRDKKLLDEDVINWIFNCYSWAFEQFDRKVFIEESVLVIPDNKHFPGKETTAHGMAELIFDQVKQYASMAHWPTQLIDLERTQGSIPPHMPIQISGELRGKNAVAHFTQMPAVLTAVPISSFPVDNQIEAKILFNYHPQQLKSPEGIIAHFVNGLSYHLVSSANSLPPGGKEYVPMANELIGIFMGFGIMSANSAHIRRGQSCGSCGVSGPVRQIVLSDEEATYALALFCHLKQIEVSKAKKYLKKHLRAFFSDSMKDCQRRIEDNTRLKLEFSAV